MSRRAGGEPPGGEGGAAASVGQPSGRARQETGAPLSVETIKKRRDFLAAARARKWSAPAFLLQGRRRRNGEGVADCARVGFTCSKKVGDAVARNRAKRRLRAAAAAVLPASGARGWDYVLIGRANVTAARPFPDLVADLETALARIHAPPKRKTGTKG